MKITTKEQDIEKHYQQSIENYDIKGESHLEYYKEKYPENYEKLKDKLK